VKPYSRNALHAHNDARGNKVGTRPSETSSTAVAAHEGFQISGDDRIRQALPVWDYEHLINSWLRQEISQGPANGFCRLK